MNSTKVIVIWSLLILAVIGGFVGLVVSQTTTPHVYDTFAQCLTDKGTKMYGAWWCPHCENEKKKFGKSWKLIDYIECSNPDGNEQLQVCTDAGIKSYPVWEFASGKRLEGETSFAQLSAESGCELVTDDAPQK